MKSTRNLAAVTAVGAAAGAAYRLSRTMSTWGATPLEVDEFLPGDELVETARYRTTHAISIDAPAEEVWRWVVQIGQGRGGMYSYDWLENLFRLDMHSADHIDPAWQDLSVGEVIRLVPEGTQPSLLFAVARLEAPSLLVLGPLGTREDAFAQGLPFPFWTFRITPTGANSSRLVVRFQSDFEPTAMGWLAYKYALEPVHFVMERKMLRTIKQRAEDADSSRRRMPAHQTGPVHPGEQDQQAEHDDLEGDPPG